MDELTFSRARAPGDVARALIEARVAPAAAAGFASRRQRSTTGARWELSAGEATAVPASFFDLASVTKPMTALAVALSGLDPRAPLAAVLDEAGGTPSAETPIELLLAHRAGLEANLPLFAPLVSGGTVDKREALRAAASARRADAEGALPEEGAAPLYSDLGYILVGEALARHCRARDAGEAIESLVVASLGLEDGLGTARALAARGVDFAHRVVPTELVPWRGGELRGVVHDENAWAMTARGGSGHAGMFATIDALLAFGVSVCDAIVRREGKLAAGDLGWLVRRRPGGDLRAGFDGKSATGASSAGVRASAETFGHLGFTGTSLWIDPEAEALVAVLTNRVHPTRDHVAIRAARPAAHDALWALAAEA